METPSVFELIQEDSLRKTFRGAIRHFVKFLFNRLPSQKLDSILNTSLFSYLSKYIDQDELILLIETIVEWSFLYKYNATFTEKFLSLQRFDADTEGPLKRKQVVLSIVSISIAPYLFKKLDNYYEHLEDKSFVTNSSELRIYERDFLAYYKNIKKLYDFGRIICWLSYACSSSSHPNPVMATLLRGVRIAYKDDDVLSNNNNNLHYRIASSVSSTFSVAFKTSAFFIQFFDYWLSQSDVRQMLSLKGSSTNIPAPVKPKTPTNNTKANSNQNMDTGTGSNGSSLRTSLSSHICPLCLRSRRNATALACSGYIFCYACITAFVSEHSKCPISGFPATLSQLIRIYD